MAASMSRLGGELPAAAVVRVVKLIGGGRALAHHDGATWMIDGALPGERVLARPIRRRRGVIEAALDEVVDDRHPSRLDDPCPHAATCGGCDWPHVDSDSGAGLKAEVAAEATGHAGDLADRLRAAPVVTSPPCYRIRSRLHWDPGAPSVGFFGRRSWRVSRIPDCRILSPGLVARLAGLTDALTACCPERLDVELLEGADGVVAALRPGRRGRSSIPAAWLPGRDRSPDVAGFHRLTTDARLMVGWGRTDVTVDLPIPLSVPMGAFFQGNRHLAAPLFHRTAELIGPGEGPVVDLHAGVGFLAAAARFAGRTAITAVEPHGGAAAAAVRNLPGARVVHGSAEEFLTDADNRPRDVVAIVDPPRSGLTPRLRAQLAAWRPPRIVALGCDPAAWARDTAELLSSGYRLTRLELFDLFPFTHHVEVVSVLELP